MANTITPSEMDDPELVMRHGITVCLQHIRRMYDEKKKTKRGDVYSPSGFDVLILPSRMRLNALLSTPAGKIALQKERMTREEAIRCINAIMPATVSELYKIAFGGADPRPSVAAQFSQAVFESGMTPAYGAAISPRLLRAIGEKNTENFEGKRPVFGAYAFSRIRELISRTTGTSEVQDKLKSGVSATDILNDIFAKATNCHAMEILNALELSGIDYTDDEIIERSLSAERCKYQPSLSQ